MKTVKKLIFNPVIRSQWVSRPPKGYFKRDNSLYRIFKISKKGALQLRLEGMYRLNPSQSKTHVNSDLALSNNYVHEAQLILELQFELDYQRKWGFRRANFLAPVSDPLNLSVDLQTPTQETGPEVTTANTLVSPSSNRSAIKFTTEAPTSNSVTKALTMTTSADTLVITKNKPNASLKLPNAPFTGHVTATEYPKEQTSHNISVSTIETGPVVTLANIVVSSSSNHSVIQFTAKASTFNDYTKALTNIPSADKLDITKNKPNAPFELPTAPFTEHVTATDYTKEQSSYNISVSTKETGPVVTLANTVISSSSNHSVIQFTAEASTSNSYTKTLTNIPSVDKLDITKIKPNAPFKLPTAPFTAQVTAADYTKGNTFHNISVSTKETEPVANKIVSSSNNHSVIQFTTKASTSNSYTKALTNIPSADTLDITKNKPNASFKLPTAPFIGQVTAADYIKENTSPYISVSTNVGNIESNRIPLQMLQAITDSIAKAPDHYTLTDPAATETYTTFLNQNPLHNTNTLRNYRKDCKAISHENAKSSKTKNFDSTNKNDNFFGISKPQDQMEIPLVDVNMNNVNVLQHKVAPSHVKSKTVNKTTLKSNFKAPRVQPAVKKQRIRNNARVNNLFADITLETYGSSEISNGVAYFGPGTENASTNIDGTDEIVGAIQQDVTEVRILPSEPKPFSTIPKCPRGQLLPDTNKTASSTKKNSSTQEIVKKKIDSKGILLSKQGCDNLNQKVPIRSGEPTNNFQLSNRERAAQVTHDNSVNRNQSRREISRSNDIPIVKQIPTVSINQGNVPNKLGLTTNGETAAQVTPDNSVNENQSRREISRNNDIPIVKPTVAISQGNVANKFKIFNGERAAHVPHDNSVNENQTRREISRSNDSPVLKQTTTIPISQGSVPNKFLLPYGERAAQPHDNSVNRNQTRREISRSNDIAILKQIPAVMSEGNVPNKFQISNGEREKAPHDNSFNGNQSEHEISRSNGLVPKQTQSVSITDNQANATQLSNSIITSQLVPQCVNDNLSKSGTAIFQTAPNNDMTSLSKRAQPTHINLPPSAPTRNNFKTQIRREKERSLRGIPSSNPLMQADRYVDANMTQNMQLIQRNPNNMPAYINPMGSGRRGFNLPPYANGLPQENPTLYNPNIYNSMSTMMPNSMQPYYNQHAINLPDFNSLRRANSSNNPNIPSRNQYSHFRTEYNNNYVNIPSRDQLRSDPSISYNPENASNAMSITYENSDYNKTNLPMADPFQQGTEATNNLYQFAANSNGLDTTGHGHVQTCCNPEYFCGAQNQYAPSSEIYNYPLRPHMREIPQKSHNMMEHPQIQQSYMQANSTLPIIPNMPQIDYLPHNTANHNTINHPTVNLSGRNLPVNVLYGRDPSRSLLKPRGGDGTGNIENAAEMPLLPKNKKKTNSTPRKYVRKTKATPVSTSRAIKKRKTSTVPGDSHTEIDYVAVINDVQPSSTLPIGNVEESVPSLSCNPNQNLWSCSSSKSAQNIAISDSTEHLSGILSNDQIMPDSNILNTTGQDLAPSCTSSRLNSSENKIPDDYHVNLTSEKISSSSKMTSAEQENIPNTSCTSVQQAENNDVPFTETVQTLLGNLVTGFSSILKSGEIMGYSLISKQEYVHAIALFHKMQDKMMSELHKTQNEQVPQDDSGIHITMVDVSQDNVNSTALNLQSTNAQCTSTHQNCVDETVFDGRDKKPAEAIQQIGNQSYQSFNPDIPGRFQMEAPSALVTANIRIQDLQSDSVYHFSDGASNEATPIEKLRSRKPNKRKRAAVQSADASIGNDGPAMRHIKVIITKKNNEYAIKKA